MLFDKGWYVGCWRGSGWEMLDPWLSLEIMKLFGRFNEIGVTMLIATHDLNLLDKVKGRRLQLGNGELIDPATDALIF